MSIQPNTITLKKLAFSRQIFNRSVLHSTSLSNIDKLISIIEFDLVTESILNAVVTSLDPTKTPSDGFPSLLNQVDSVLTNAGLGTMPDRANIVHVHNIRNDAQHDGRYPNPNELNDCHTYTRDFLKKISQLVWNLDFHKISMTDLIQNTKIQANLKAAEKALQINDYKTTVQQSVSGLQKALNYVSRSLVGPSLFRKKVMIADAFGRDPQPDDSVSRTIEKIQNTLSFISLGLNSLDFMKFKEITGQPLFSVGNEDPIDFFDTKDPLTIDDAEFALSYAIDSIIMIENRVGNIEKPFGKDSFAWF
jgi:hypothetical protein